MKKIFYILAFMMPIFLTAQNTVMDVISNSPDHTTLQAALEAAGLDATLNGTGPFTVFAPTDAAFDALPMGTVDALLMNPSGDLTDILLYHVLSGEVASSTLTDGMTATTINGKDITVSIMNGEVRINDALVTVVDIPADNGLVHVIDAVLLPPVVTVVDIIVNSPDHNTLEAAVIAADLATTLSGDGPFTVFAPTDAAFDALPMGTLDALLVNPSGDLTDILLYHVLSGEVASPTLTDGMTATTINGKDITVSIMNGEVRINDALVTIVDIPADNGLVHVIDAVLLPETSSNEEIGDFTAVSVYPNPTMGKLSLNVEGLDISSNAEINILSANGQKLNTINAINNNTEIDLGTYSNGIYLIELINAQQRYYKKVMLQR